MSELKAELKADAANYLKGVLRDLPVVVPREVKILLGEMIIHAYLRGREDEKACGTRGLQ